MLFLVSQVSPNWTTSPLQQKSYVHTIVTLKLRIVLLTVLSRELTTSCAVAEVQRAFPQSFV